MQSQCIIIGLFHSWKLDINKLDLVQEMLNPAFYCATLSCLNDMVTSTLYVFMMTLEYRIWPALVLLFLAPVDLVGFFILEKCSRNSFVTEFSPCSISLSLSQQEIVNSISLFPRRVQSYLLHQALPASFITKKMWSWENPSDFVMS